MKSQSPQQHCNSLGIAFVTIPLTCSLNASHARNNAVIVVDNDKCCHWYVFTMPFIIIICMHGPKLTIYSNCMQLCLCATIMECQWLAVLIDLHWAWSNSHLFKETMPQSVPYAAAQEMRLHTQCSQQQVQSSIANKTTIIIIKNVCTQLNIKF